MAGTALLLGETQTYQVSVRLVGGDGGGGGGGGGECGGGEGGGDSGSGVVGFVVLSSMPPLTSGLFEGLVVDMLSTKDGNETPSKLFQVWVD